MKTGIKFLLYLISTLVFLIALDRALYGAAEKTLTYRLTNVYAGIIFNNLIAFLFILLILYIFQSKTLILLVRSIKTNSILRLRPLGQKDILSISVHVFVVTLITYYFISKRSNNIFIGVDGDFSQNLNRAQNQWGTSTFELGNNFLQGLGGNIWFPVNSKNDLGYLLGDLFHNFNENLAFSAWAALLFVSTFILANSLQLKKSIGILSGWFAVFLILYPSFIQFSVVSKLIPHISTTISVNNLILALIIDRRFAFKKLIVKSILLLLLIIYFLINNPTFIFLALPIDFIILAPFLLNRVRGGKLISQLVLFIPTLIMFVLSGYKYLIGLYSYTAVGNFPQDFQVQSKNLKSISSFFLSTPIKIIFIFIFVSIILNLMFSTQLKIRFLSMSSALFILIIFAFGFLYTWNPNIWDGPSPNYFEFFAWPIYCLFLAIFIDQISKLSSERITKLKKYTSRITTTSETISIIAVLFLFLFANTEMPSQKYWSLPPKSNTLLEEIKEISAKPNELFKGRQATFTGLNYRQPVSWNDLSKFDNSIMVGDFSNDHRMSWFWYNSIPTLTEYNPLTSPRLFKVTTSLLGKSDDIQIRNMLNLRELDINILKLFGVSMLVTDKSIPNLIPKRTLKGENTELYLYHLKATNLGNYSPSKLIFVGNFQEAIDQMKSKDIDLRSVAFATGPNVTPKLVPASNSELIILKNGFKLNATSKSTSMIVVPFEYSNCLKFNNSIKSSEFRTLPVNLALTGVIFSGTISLTAQYENSLFKNSSCRFSDVKLLKEEWS